MSASGTAIVSAISYLPFGPATGYTFAGGGQSLDKLYDANYHVTDIEGSALNLHFTLDAMGDIKAEGNAAGVPTPNESYRYDPLYRLQEVDNATGTPWQTYTYNGTGDRLTKATAGLGTDSYSYQTGTHRLLNISGYDVSNRAVDANGNTTAFQANGWTYGLGYNDTNRLALVQQNGSTVATYGLNGRGERVAKTLVGGGTQAYTYDEAGHLLGEYATGQSRDYVWADGTLVAIMDNPAQGGDAIHYVYTDNLGTPRSVTTQVGNLVWDWPYNQNPFGEAAASGSGYTLNLRYPGQYFDQEDGLNYNYFRDYESATGRYVQSDPAGLKGGVNTYAYVSDNPANLSDPFGKEAPGPWTYPPGPMRDNFYHPACRDSSGNVQWLIYGGGAGAWMGGMGGMLYGAAYGASTVEETGTVMGGLEMLDAIGNGAIAGGVTGLGWGAVLGGTSGLAYYYWYNSLPSCGCGN